MSEDKIMSDNQVKDLIDSVMPEIKNKLKQQVIGSVSNQLKYIIEQTIDSESKKFIEGVIVPETRLYLIENKEGLTKILNEALAKVLTEGARCIVETAGKNFESSYKREKIIKALFE
jgi:division protein CdvB (Snf7/Vps24/ESCRT-III family)